MVKESVGTFEVQVDRKNGADGQVSVAFKTTEINAISDKDFVGILIKLTYFLKFCYLFNNLKIF